MLLIVIAALTAAVIILWPLMRAFARRLEGKGGDDSGPSQLRTDGEQTADGRVAEVDRPCQHRVSEPSSRSESDFTETMLAGPDPGPVGADAVSGHEVLAARRPGR